MTLHYASTFADALANLTHQEQKQVKITTVDLMIDPKGSGLSLERLNRSSDDKLWSARVSRDLRIIMRRDGDDLLLAYVGHHDDAYGWAERRKIIPHERTGAMQIVELVERQEQSPDYSTDVAQDQQSTAPEFDQPFWALDDDQMLDVGVPRDWLQAVRETRENEIDSLFERLPAEAAEALYDFATGGKLEDHAFDRAPSTPRIRTAISRMAASSSELEISEASDVRQAYLHPDAQRRFRVIENVEELQAALDAPFEKWAVFLHPLQRATVERPWSGPARVSGSAGTGKTIVALHRAVHLAEQDGARVLLTTFSERLANNLAAKSKLLTEARPGVRERIDVRSIDQAACELYSETLGDPALADPERVKEAITAAMEAGHGGDHSFEFLAEEWDEVVDAWGLSEPGAYADVPRIGRKVRLGANQRASAWEVFAFVREWLAERGLITWADLYGQLEASLNQGMTLPYSHFVVDEAQDLSVAQARFLAAAGRNRDDALFFAGDIGQRIFHLPFSWLKLGLDIRGRSQVLKVCYRTSHQIRRTADRLLAPEIADQDGYTESRRGTVSVFEGPDPDIEMFANEQDEIVATTAWLRARLAEDIAPAEIAVIVRSEDQFDRARAVVSQADAEIAVLAMHDTKGLEYRACAVMAVDEDVLPDPVRLEGVGDIADLEALQDAERHLLYVACTRARDRLMISGVEPGSEFLDDILAGPSTEHR